MMMIVMGGACADCATVVGTLPVLPLRLLSPSILFLPLHRPSPFSPICEQKPCQSTFLPTLRRFRLIYVHPGLLPWSPRPRSRTAWPSLSKRPRPPPRQAPARPREPSRVDPRSRTGSPSMTRRALARSPRYPLAGQARRLPSTAASSGRASRVRLCPFYRSRDSPQFARSLARELTALFSLAQVPAGTRTASPQAEAAAAPSAGLSSSIA